MADPIATRVAGQLLASLKSHAIPVIDIDVIRDALRCEAGCPPFGCTAFDCLEEETVRLIVERA